MAMKKAAVGKSSLKREDKPQVPAASSSNKPAAKSNNPDNLPAITVPKNLAQQMAQDAEENMKNVNDAFFRVSIEGGRFKVGGSLIGDKGVEFDAIILREIPVNLFYSTKYDPNEPTSPDCWSLGGHKPDPGCQNIQSDSCISCKNNRFGTGTGQDGKRSKGKACRNTRRLVLKVDGVDMPVIMTLPPTAIRSLNAYLKKLSSNEPPVPMYAVITKFGFDSGAQYPKPVLDYASMVPADEYMAIREYRAGAEVINAMNAFASPQDFIEGEAKEGGEEEGF